MSTSSWSMQADRQHNSFNDIPFREPNMASAIAEANESLKQRVRKHWEAETCGTRYSEAPNRRCFFDELANKRYQLEPDLHTFADFPSSKGKRVLEIGVGAGADFHNWCRFADHATGVDLTEEAIALTTERLQLNDIDTARYQLQKADAEKLPFSDSTFDIVYSWGVLHHTPNTLQAFGEAWRVLRPGGVLKAMVYQVPSWVGWMLALNYGLARGKLWLTPRQAIFEQLESPGTKAYTVNEARTFLNRLDFEQVNVWSRLTAGDLLLIKPSKKHAGWKSNLIWAVYPRWLVRILGHRFGLNLMVTARKPMN